MQNHLLYIGTYTDGASEGIYRAQFNPQTGALGDVALAAAIENPSFLELSDDRRFLISVIENRQTGAEPGGAITTFSIESTGDLRATSPRLTRGESPCYIMVSADGKSVLTVNYYSGSISCFDMDPVTGSLGPMAQYVQHEGASIDPQRQKAAHTHAVVRDAAGRVYCTDLGMDRVMIYELRAGRLIPNDPAYAEVSPGQGPRHLTFHPTLNIAYLINELASIITVFRHAPENGALEQLQSISALPTDFTGVSHCADIHVHPSGRFLYGSNRGHDSLVMCAIDAHGLVNITGHEPSGGKTPRNFAIDPSGDYLLVANQDSNSILSFRIDQQSGALQPTGHLTQVPSPVCLKFHSLEVS